MYKRIPDLEKGAAVMRREPPAVTVGVVTNHSCGKCWNSELHYYYYYYTEECLNWSAKTRIDPVFIGRR